MSHKTDEKPSYLLVDLNTVENADSNSLFLQSVSWSVQPCSRDIPHYCKNFRVSKYEHSQDHIEKTEGYQELLGGGQNRILEHLLHKTDS